MNTLQLDEKLFDKIPPISAEELDKQNREFSTSGYYSISQEDANEIKDQLIRMNCWD